MKKRFNSTMLLFCFLTGVLLFANLPVKTQAASSDYAYENAYLLYKPKDRIKFGKYYVWIEESTTNAQNFIKMSKTKTGKGTTLAASPKNGSIKHHVSCNGQKLYYVTSDYTKHTNSIVGITLSNKKKKTYKTISTEKYSIATPKVYGNYLFYDQLTSTNSNLRHDLMRLDLKKKRTKKVKPNYAPVTGSTRYMYIFNASTSEITNNQFYVYDCKTGKTRRLIKPYMWTFQIYKDKLYVADQRTNGYCYLYRFNTSGTGKKLWKKIRLNEGYTMFRQNYIYFVNQKGESAKYYRMQLASKKVQALTRDQFFSLTEYQVVTKPFYLK